MQKKTKIIIAIVAATVVIGGTVGTVLGVNAYQEKKAAEELKAQQEQLVKDFNDKINAIVTPLNVPDANGQNPSIENNNDVNTLQTAITQLQNLDKEVTENTVITEEQKNTLKTTIATHITTIQNRINAVNEANAEAQRQAEAEAQRQQAEAQAEAQRQARAQASSNKKKNSGGSSSSASSSSNNSGGSSANTDSGNSDGSSNSGSSGGSSVPQTDGPIGLEGRNPDGTFPPHVQDGWTKW